MTRVAEMKHLAIRPLEGLLRGYVPDGKGLTYDGCPVRQGDEITVNDGLVLYLTKTLPSGRHRGECKG